ncbi:MAG: hypothetical protein HY826_04760 [Actinobacteria bacterium]|nr:hypothetical protein [Actinomycetota bacterium]
MAAVPVLLLGFNRPDRLADLVESLRATAPPVVRVAIDGPRATHADDLRRVSETRAAVQRIDWTDDVGTLFRDANLGLEQAVPAAVSWVLDEFESVIVIEDDVGVGGQFVEFATRALRTFEKRSEVFHVSGYNVVPQDIISDPAAAARLSRVAESFAWATWRRAWQHYDPTLKWGTDCSIAELAAVLGSRTAAIRWKQNFSLARHGRISSWAYRWMASIWQHDGYCLSPNCNLITYRGYRGGTHTRRRARWTEFPIEPVDLAGVEEQVTFDVAADEYLHRQVFRATPLGIGLGPAEALALEALKRR